MENIRRREHKKTVSLVEGDTGRKWKENSSSESWNTIQSTQPLWWKAKTANGE
jgi:hypothetical protein